MTIHATGLLEFGLYGIPMVGADICGFIKKDGERVAEDLCARWISLGSFYPFSRTHNINSGLDQDPASFGNNSMVLSAAKRNLRMRYQLVPYLYTLLHESSVSGTPVMRPLFFEFPKEQNAYEYSNSEFMLGSAILVIPVLEENVTSVKGYFPDGKWYDYEAKSGKSPVNTIGGKTQDITLELDRIGIYMRDGQIIPTYNSDNYKTVTEMVKNEKFIIIASLGNNAKAKAYGQLYQDDGISTDTIRSGKYNLIEFKIENGDTFTTNIVKADYDLENFEMKQLIVLGLDVSKVSNVTVNGNDILETDFDFRDSKLMINYDVSLFKPITIKWF